VYVTWNDRRGGTVKRASTSGKGAKTIVSRPGHYVSASFSPDDRWVVLHRGSGDRYRGRLWDEDPGIYLVDADGKNEPRLLTREGREPRFDRTGERVFLIQSEGEKTALVCVNLLGSDRRVHATSERAMDFALSPDERFLAFEELWNTYVTPFSVQAKTIEVSPEMKNLPVRKLSKDGGTYLSWSPDSRTVYWSLGPEMFSIEVDTLFVEKPLPDTTKADGDADEGDGEHVDASAGDGSEAGEKPDDETAEDEDKPEPAVLALGWSEPADMPATDVWLVGGTILPMHELTAIDDGVIHVKGNRIVAIGSRSDVAVPANAQAIDVSGKIVMPGLVDIHAHTGSSNQSVSSQQNWAFLANLAFGVTTTHDPSNNSQMIFATSEMQEAGKVVGPRVFSTGTILYGAEGDFKTSSATTARSPTTRMSACGSSS
jgi:hypothetical protein